MFFPCLIISTYINSRERKKKKFFILFLGETTAFKQKEHRKVFAPSILNTNFDIVLALDDDMITKGTFISRFTL